MKWRIAMPLILTCGLLGPLGCKSQRAGARDTFVERYSCPPDRVVVKERSDLSAAELNLRVFSVDARQVESEPPKEVRDDPERLALWRAARDQREHALRRSYDNWTVFQVSGCDHEELLLCHHPGGPKGTDLGRVSCRMVKP
jgi:hypothetical protein